MTTAITFSASLLSGYYSARSGLAATSAAERAGTTAAAPNAAGAGTPPWRSTSTAKTQSALVKSVLNGGAFFNAQTLTSGSAAPPSSSYNTLFTLYQGVTALQGLASGASSLTPGAPETTAYAKAFASGLSQLQSYVATSRFSGMRVAAGVLSASQETTAGAPVETDLYTTGAVYSGAANDPVPAFAAGGAFTMTLTETSGGSKTVSFDLSDIEGPKTMNSVAAYFNATLEAAGAKTRFAVVDTPAAPVTTVENGKTVTLSQPPDALSFKIVGTDQETPTFQAASSAPAVYVTSASGPKATSPSAATASQIASSAGTAPGASASGLALLSFNAGSSGSAAPIGRTPLASAATSALASATAPDGSVYVLSTVDGAVAGQPISGASDVALTKYDSAGKLVYMRTLGASDAASGYALAVSADGSQVAVAGSVTGPLTGAGASSASLTSKVANSFVAAYDAAGDEQWSATQPSATTSAATGLAFGADGSLYVTGSSSGRMPGAAAASGGDGGFLQGYSAKGALSFTTQFASDAGGPAGVAVSGSSVYVAGDSAGDALVRQFTVGPSGAAAGATQNLGALGGGSVAGIAIGADGQVVVAGSTSNGSLQAGSVGGSYEGGRAGFVASLDPSLASGAGTVSYLSTPGDLSDVKMTMSDGQVYLAGAVAITAPAGSGYSDASEGYIASVDPTSGSVGWSQTYQGAEDRAAPTSVAVASAGASILTSLGLPTSIDYATSKLLVSNTSLTAGDSFGVKVGSGPVEMVTVSAGDTLQSLALKVERASGFNATANTPTVAGETQLKLAPANSTASIQLIAGPTGADALSALGLSAGTLTAASSASSASSSGARPASVNLGLNLSGGLNLQSAASIAAAKTALNLASAKIQTAFASLTAPASSGAAGAAGAGSAAAVAAAQSLAANYQQALNWLNNNETSSSSPSSPGLSSLIV